MPLAVSARLPQRRPVRAVAEIARSARADASVWQPRYRQCYVQL